MDVRQGPDGTPIKDVDFIRKCLILIGLILLVLLAWKLADVLLLAFGAILVAIILRAFADLLVRYVRIPQRLGLAAASVLVLAMFIGLGIVFGSNIRTQLTNVFEQLPGAVNAFGQRLGLDTITDDLSSMLSSQTSGLAMRIAGIGGSIVGGLADFFLVIIAGLYVAASPRIYFDGFVKLFPIRHHERVEGSLDASGQALKLWLVSQMIAMICVGSLSTIAFWLIGLPSPYALGLIAGLLEFIPFLGPILGALPAVLISFTLGGDAVMWTLIGVFIIQQLEGNVIFPLVGKAMVNIPPALALFGIVMGGILFGGLGMMFGFPLLVVVYVLVKKLYVRETLGESTPIPGETKPAELKAE